MSKLEQLKRGGKKRDWKHSPWTEVHEHDSA